MASFHYQVLGICTGPQLSTDTSTVHLATKCPSVSAGSMRLLRLPDARTCGAAADVSRTLRSRVDCRSIDVVMTMRERTVPWMALEAGSSECYTL